MTLCLAVKYPLSYLKNYPAPLEEAIIFVSDSRITFADGTKDIVEKIVPICSNAVITIAGAARFQLESILNMRYRLGLENKHTIDNVLDIVADCYRSKLSLHGQQVIAHSILGIYDHSDGKVKLFKIMTDLGLSIYELNSHEEMFFIGTEEMRQEFTKLEINQAIKNQDGNGLAFYPLDWTRLIYRVFNEEVNIKKQENTVGGIIQSACLYKSGIEWANHMAFNFDKNGDMIVYDRTVRKDNGWERLLKGGKEEKTFPLKEVLKEIK